MKKEYQSPVTQTVKIGPAILSSTSANQVTRIDGNAEFSIGGGGNNDTEQRARSSSVWDE